MRSFFFVRVAAALGAATALIATAGVTTYAPAASASVVTVTSHSAAPHLTAIPITSSRGAVASNPCVYPSHDFCVFQNFGCTSNGYVVPTANHSQWINFGAVGVPYHPQCIYNASHSSVWGEDEATEVASCAHPDQGFKSQHEQFGWFYVKYNVGTCGSEPSGE